jgi:proteasome accessory factor C
MTEHKRLFNLLQMIALLSRPGGYTVKRLSKRFQVTDRTIYRYFDLLRECGFRIEKAGNRRRFKQPSAAQTVLPLFSADEAAMISQAVVSLHSAHPKKTGLLKKLKLMSDPVFLADLIVDAKTAANVESLTAAIRDKKRVILHNYQSPSSETTMNRTADPIGFSTNVKYLYAFEPSHQKVVQFKPERIERVEITNQVYTPDERYRIEKPDLFGMNGTPHTEITLRMNSRALRLLLEEFPESRNLPGLSESGNLKDLENNHHKMILPVKGFDGAGRFVLGLPGEAVPLGPPDFLRYLENRMNKGTIQKQEKR